MKAVLMRLISVCKYTFFDTVGLKVYLIYSTIIA